MMVRTESASRKSPRSTFCVAVFNKIIIYRLPDISYGLHTEQGVYPCAFALDKEIEYFDCLRYRQPLR